MSVAEVIKVTWYQFAPLPADGNELCAACGKSGGMCRGRVSIAGFPCCGQRHIWGMVHRQSGATAPPFDSPEARLMMYDVIDLNEAGRRSGIGNAIRRHYRHWRERTRDE